uniref:Uncharacterized protein n=1 Tax=Rhizophora mucronata TaxID=61149 RepID=A0A2P2QNQ9_RHIMU
MISTEILSSPYQLPLAKLFPGYTELLCMYAFYDLFCSLSVDHIFKYHKV